MKRRQRVVNSQRGINLDKCSFTASSILEQILSLFVNIISLSLSRTLLSTWTNEVEIIALQLFPHWNIFYILTTILILLLNWNTTICTVDNFFCGECVFDQNAPLVEILRQLWGRVIKLKWSHFESALNNCNRSFKIEMRGSNRYAVFLNFLRNVQLSNGCTKIF